MTDVRLLGIGSDGFGLDCMAAKACCTASCRTSTKSNQNKFIIILQSDNFSKRRSFQVDPEITIIIKCVNETETVLLKYTKKPKTSNRKSFVNIINNSYIK